MSERPDIGAIQQRADATHTVLQDVAEERRKQHEKWGTQRHDWPVWITVLSEEVGELSQQVLAFRARWFAYHELPFPSEDDGRQFTADMLDIRAKMRAEAIQVAAVAVAMVEHLDDP